MITPAFLTSGDSAAIVAPAGKLKKNALDDAIKILGDWGLKVLLGKNVYSEAHNYLSGADNERMSDLQSALDDESVKAIFCARGGYGITRIIDQLDFTEFLKRPKWIVGFSDITALHLQLNNLGCESIHGIMPLLFTKPNTATSVESLKRILFEGLQDIAAIPNKYNGQGTAVGETIGGNLTLIVDSIGTKSEPDTKGKILILEEIEEYKYKIDRMMTHLKRADKLNDLAGLAIGHMTNISDTETVFGESVEEIILNKVKEFKYPVAFEFPTGHDNPNVAWRSGSKMKLEVTAEGSHLTSFNIM